MSEARIEIKVVANRFVTCFPMSVGSPDEAHTLHWPQHIQSSRSEQITRHRHCGDDASGIGGYISTREDQSA